MNNYSMFGKSTISASTATTTKKMKNAFVFNEEEFRNAFKVQSNEGS
jgi:hypothetical protein